MAVTCCWGCDHEMKVAIRPLDADYNQCAVALIGYNSGPCLSENKAEFRAVLSAFRVPIPPSGAGSGEERTVPCPLTAAGRADITNTTKPGIPAEDPLDSALWALKRVCTGGENSSSAASSPSSSHSNTAPTPLYVACVPSSVLGRKKTAGAARGRDCRLQLAASTLCDERRVRVELQEGRMMRD